MFHRSFCCCCRFAGWPLRSALNVESHGSCCLRPSTQYKAISFVQFSARCCASEETQAHGSHSYRLSAQAATAGAACNKSFCWHCFCLQKCFRAADSVAFPAYQLLPLSSLSVPHCCLSHSSFPVWCSRRSPCRLSVRLEYCGPFSPANASVCRVLRCIGFLK